MAAREYQGAGGLRLHLDEPLSDEMAKQVARGHLVPVGDAPEVEPEPEAPAKQEATAGNTLPKRPGANAKAETWQTYAIALGMDPDQAKDATKQECQDYTQVVEDARETNAQTEGQE